MIDIRQILLNAVEQADLTESVRIGQICDYRSFKVTLIDDAQPLDPAVTAQLNQAWDQWTSTCTSEVIEKARAEKLDRMKRAHELTFWHQLMLQMERDAVIEDIVSKGAQPCVEPEPTEDDSPKPTTPRERLRTMKAHPRSVRGRR
jgi:hypothetical protein